MSDSNTTITTGPVSGRDELRTVALSAIEVRDGFNPRERFDDRELERLAASIARRGLLQPLVVTPAEQPGSYQLVAGERRYRACFAVGLTEVPVLVRPLAREEDVDGALIDAVVENLHRSDHTPVEEATAFARLLQAGLTRKGICEQLSVTRERVRDRLQLLDVPRELHGAIDKGEIPLAAVPALVQLAGIHPELPSCAYRRVTQPPEQSWQRPTSWADVAADPIGAVTCRYAGEAPQLPDGVYEADASYPLASFPLSEKARRDLEHLAEVDEVWTGEGSELMITPAMVEHAGTLSAAFCSPHNRSALIVGADVAGELAGAVIAKRLKEERARLRRSRERHTVTPQTAGADLDEGPLSEQDRERAAEKSRRAEREAERQARLDAEAYNDRVGAAIVKTLSTVKIDTRVIEVLTAVDLDGELDGIAMRGARYGFPGWVAQETTKGGKVKRVYLERPQALAKAHEYLAGAERPAEIAGRCVALIAMAVLADEECVARSNRSGHSLYHYRTSHYDHGTPTGLAWARNVVSLVEEICVEQLPAAATERLRERRDCEQAERARADAGSQAAEVAYHDLVKQFETLGTEEREAAIAAYEHEHPAGDFLLEELQTRHEQLNAAHASPSATYDAAIPIDTDVDAGAHDDEAEALGQAA